MLSNAFQCLCSPSVLISFNELLSSAQIGVLTKWAQDVLCPLYQHHAQIRVTLPCNMQLRFTLPGVPPARLQSYITTSIAALSKPPRVFQRQVVCQRNQCPNTIDLLEQCNFRITLFCKLLDLGVILSDSRGDRFERA